MNFTSTTTKESSSVLPLSVTITHPSYVVTSASDTCNTTISFITPTDIGGYQVKINAADSVTGQGSNTTLIGKDLYICFTVNESVVIPNINTTLTVDQQCVLLNAGEVDLKATLKESNSNSKPISEAIIYFYINPELDPDGNLTGNNEDNYIGYATTNEDGIATLTFNVNGLGVEDHNLYAEYRGYSNYNPSNDSNTPWH